MTDDHATRKVPSGTRGLDEVLHGGFVQGHTSIVMGGPGTGKSILALQFLAAGDHGLYVGFEERESEIRRNATALGIDLSNVDVLDLSAGGDRFFADDAYTVFEAEELEGEALISEMARAIEREGFDRLVVDPLTEMRALLPDDFQFRRNISSLFNSLVDRGITTVCTAQPEDRQTMADIQFLGNATIELERTTARRTLEVTKYRGSPSASGRHTYRILPETGARVYPKLVPGDHHREADREPLPTGRPNLDSLLGGGLERGSVTVIAGPSGVGKTTTATLALESAAGRGDRGIAFLFEELREDYLFRAKALGLEVADQVEAGVLEVAEVEALTRSPDEFAADVRAAVEERDVSVVMIDGTAGYRLGLRGDDSQTALTRELHALCRYLKRMGVTTILIEEIGTITGEFTPTDSDISYLADNIVFLRYLEVDGSIEKAIGVLKKRFGTFERSLRSLSINREGIEIGEPLTGYRGLLTGTPEPIDEGLDPKPTPGDELGHP